MQEVEQRMEQLPNPASIFAWTNERGGFPIKSGMTILSCIYLPFSLCELFVSVVNISFRHKPLDYPDILHKVRSANTEVCHGKAL